MSHHGFLRCLAFGATLAVCSAASAQIHCDPLTPAQPRDMALTVTGKIDEALLKFVNKQGAIEGTYTEASKDILKEYPNADRLFLWSRMLYLYCENIRISSLTDEQKISALNDIARRIDSPQPQQGEHLLDPPILQFGMTRGQVLTLLRARTPLSLADNNRFITALRALTVGREPGSIPEGSQNVIRANARLFELQGEGIYGFDRNDRLSWMTIWNLCARDIHEFSNPEGVHPSYFEWASLKDDGDHDMIDCPPILELKGRLSSRFGMPSSTMSDTNFGAKLPDNVQICHDLFELPTSVCFGATASRNDNKYRFLAQDRITPVDLTLRTLRYSATHGRMTKIRERRVAVLTVSNSSAEPIPPVITGNLWLYLQ